MKWSQNDFVVVRFLSKEGKKNTWWLRSGFKTIWWPLGLQVKKNELVATKSPSEKKNDLVVARFPSEKRKEKPIWWLPSFKKKKKNLTLDYEKLNGHQVFFLRKQ